MDFTAQIKALASRLPSMEGNIQTEQATKQGLVLPFIQALGYNVFDLNEVVPEYDANVGASRKFKLDYAIFKDGKPIILIECKCISDKLEKDDAYTQLFTYYAAVDARIGILTNGRIYRLYADLDKPNKMDIKPFLEIDLLQLKDSHIEELKRITKSEFDIEKMMTAATDLKYVGGILSILNEQMTAPSEDFTKVFFNRLCPEKMFVANAKAQFAEHTKRALKQFVRDQVNMSLGASEFSTDSHLSIPTPSAETTIAEPVIEDNTEAKIVTTAEEREGFYIVKSILREVIDPGRITDRDVQSYFGILLDNNNRKPICRLYFNNLKALKIGLFNHGTEDKQEERFAIDKLDDIYLYSAQLKATVAHYASVSSTAA